MKILKYILYLTVFIFLTWFLASCANPVTPKGGPEDTNPPVLLNASPPQSSLNFTSTKIQLEFDEYVELKKINDQMIISPPMEETPEFKIKGKSVIIELKSELKDSTTYNIYLGDAIVDITEANPVKNFSYVFSTGTYLDSLSLKGNLVDAFDLKPVENVSILLYIDNNDTIPIDSLPFLVKPYYLSRTDENGLFELHNLLDKQFKIFALEDLNSNLVYDAGAERIAFIDSLITPFYVDIPVYDTTLQDSLAIIDSVLQETLKREELIIYPEIEKINYDSILSGIPDYEDMPDSLLFNDDDLIEVDQPLQLFLFTENDSIQRFLKATMVNENKLSFIFRLPTLKHDIEPLNLEKDTTWFIEDINKTKDTISYWITSIIQDSIQFKIADDTIILDTIDVAIVKKSRNKREKKKEDEKPIQLKINYSKKAPELNLPLAFNFSFPIFDYSLDGAMLIEGEDTLSPEFHFSDSLKLRGLFTHKWKEETGYTLLIPDSAFTDMLYHSHDTVRNTFRTKALADYGNLYVSMKIENPNKNHIIQLMKGEKIHTEIQLTESQKIPFEYLEPGDYTLKVIYDDNTNGQWDTGDYLYNIQPEKVGFLQKIITVRANWDIEEVWEF